MSFINQSKKQEQLFLLKTDIVTGKLKSWEQVPSLTTDIDAFSMMEGFYVCGVEGGGLLCSCMKRECMRIMI